MHEVETLVMDQIRAAGQAVKNPKAVVMVGGFSQNAYLRDRIREVAAILNVEVLQSPNGYTLHIRRAAPMLTLVVGLLSFEERS